MNLLKGVLGPSYWTPKWSCQRPLTRLDQKLGKMTELKDYWIQSVYQTVNWRISMMWQFDLQPKPTHPGGLLGSELQFSGAAQNSYQISRILQVVVRYGRGKVNGWKIEVGMSLLGQLCCCFYFMCFGWGVGCSQTPRFRGPISDSQPIGLWFHTRIQGCETSQALLC